MKIILETDKEINFEVKVLSDIIKVNYNKLKQNYYVDEKYFLTIPHIEKDGKVCLYGNERIYINDEGILNHEIIVGKYIPFLFSLDRKNKLIELVLELKYYMSFYNNLEITETYIKKVNNKKNIETTNDFKDMVNKLSDIRYNGKFGIYVNNILQCKVEKNGKNLKIDFDVFETACVRVNKNKTNKFNGKSILFIGMGSVNSYILKNILIEKPKYIELFDNDKFKLANIFRHAFYIPKEFKVIAVEKFMKQIPEIKVQAHKKNFSLEDCKKDNYDYTIVSVDNIISWTTIIEQLEEIKTEKIILIGISAFGGFGKCIQITNHKNIKKSFLEFMNFSSGEPRRRVVTGGCGTSTAIYNEFDLLYLSREVINNCSEEVLKVDFKN